MRVSAVPVLAALGLADAAYLSVLHWIGEVPPCGGYGGCAQVNTSPYAEIFGVPIAALGTILYATLLGLGVWRVRAEGVGRARATLAMYGLVVAGAVFMAYLTAIEFFVLQAVCYWCLALAMITLVLLFMLATEVWGLGAKGLASLPRRA